MYIRFISDASITGTGFNASVQKSNLSKHLPFDFLLLPSPLSPSFVSLFFLSPINCSLNYFCPLLLKNVSLFPSFSFPSSFPFYLLLSCLLFSSLLPPLILSPPLLSPSYLSFYPLPFPLWCSLFTFSLITHLIFSHQDKHYKSKDTCTCYDMEPATKFLHKSVRTHRVA